MAGLWPLDVDRLCFCTMRRDVMGFVSPGTPEFLGLAAAVQVDNCSCLCGISLIRPNVPQNSSEFLRITSLFRFVSTAGTEVMHAFSTSDASQYPGVCRVGA